MSLLITGSIATDHLMSFPGKFSDSLVVDQLDKLSVSFLVEDLEVRRGGCAANICFGLGNLGLEPVLVGAVGEDFVDYRAWLERHHVDCGSVHVSPTRHTARFVCTNDASHAQIASFYAGAMSEAREIELKPIADRAGEPDYVLVGPNDPEAMLRHTDECRSRGYRFVADPSQQLAFSDGELIRPLIDGADILFSNEYEAALITQKTGWSAEEVLARVGTWVVTLGAAGVRIDRKGEESITVAGGPGDPEGRADRRGRRVPRRLPGRPVVGTRAPSAPPSSAACSRSTSSSRSAPRSTPCPGRRSWPAAGRRTATRRSPTSSRTCRRSGPDRLSSRAWPSRSTAPARARGGRSRRRSRARRRPPARTTRLRPHTSAVWVRASASNGQLASSTVSVLEPRLVALARQHLREAGRGRPGAAGRRRSSGRLGGRLVDRLLEGAGARPGALDAAGQDVADQVVVAVGQGDRPLRDRRAGRACSGRPAPGPVRPVRRRNSASSSPASTSRSRWKLAVCWARPTADGRLLAPDRFGPGHDVLVERAAGGVRQGARRRSPGCRGPRRLRTAL